MLKRGLLHLPLLLALVLVLGAGTGFAQQREIRGLVTDSQTGDPIAGAQISIKGTRTFVLSVEDGSYRIVVPAGELRLLLTFLGYRPQEVAISANQTQANVTMELDPLRLAEVVVTGQTTGLSRRNLPNTVVTITSNEIEKVPAETIEKIFQGRVNGAIVETNSGAPGGGVQVRLRGTSTINAASTPLYVVDGVLISDVAIPSNQNEVNQSTSGSNPAQTQDAQVNRVADINPWDIETIEILKGAAAAAIYGQRAANGVVIITTKKGQPGAPKFRFTQRFGTFDLSNKLGLRSFETVDEAVAAFGEPARAFFDSTTGAPLATFDQEELIAGNNPLSHETQASVSGGDANTQYFSSFLWKGDEGIIDNTGFDKQSLRVNLTQRFSPKLQLSANTNLIHTEARRGLTNNDNSGTSYWVALRATPEFVDLQADSLGLFPNNPFERSNPLQTAALSRNEEDVWRILGAIAGEWGAVQSLSHNLTFLANFGVDWFAQKNSLFFPPELQFEPNDDGLPGTSLLSNSDNLNYNIGAHAIYSYTPRSQAWTLTTATGFTFENLDLDVSRIVARNLSAGNDNVNAGTVIGVKESKGQIRNEGLYLQFEGLGMEDRLLLTVGGRLDRSSTNGSGQTFFFYPKAGASYRFTNLGGAFNELKLRAAWGQSGNLPLFGQQFTNVFIDRNIEQNPGVVLSDTLGNADIKPERQSEIEVGFDLLMWGDRALFEAVVYQRNVTDLILTRTTAPSSGFRQEILNGGELRVRGLELKLDVTPVQTSRFSWISRNLFFTVNSKIVDLPVPSFRAGGFGTTTGAFQIENGASATQIVAPIAEGDSTRVTKVGDAEPDFIMLFNNELQLGQFDAFFIFDWRQGGDVINLTKLLWDLGQNTIDYEDDPQFVENIGPTQVNDTLTLGERRVRGFGVETRPYIESATYVKLREFTLGWTLPPSTTQRWFRGFIGRMRLYFMGRNLLRFTGYTGLDPEVSNFGNQPVGRNVDVAPFPPSRSYWIGLDLDF